MKKYFTILLFLISISLNAEIYYVANAAGGGDDAHPGTLAEPWLTWQKAFNTAAVAGDTVYFRGGTYPAYSVNYGATLKTTNVDGTYAHPTCFFAYPADWAAGNYPILDCQTMTNVTKNWGIEISRCSNIYFKGLHLKNVRQVSTNVQAQGWYIWSEGSKSLYAPNNIRFENCVTHHIGGGAFARGTADTLYFINCDAYECCDSITTYDPGGAGRGFGIFGRTDTFNDVGISYAYLHGCRAWHCSDQGYSISTAGLAVVDSCWSIDNGNAQWSGNTGKKGSGWKIWYYNATYISNKLQLEMRYCIGAYNNMYGISFTNDPSSLPQARVHLYNNFVYHNGLQHNVGGATYGTGFYDGIDSDTTGRWDRWFWNNLSYDNTGYSGYHSYTYGDWLPDYLNIQQSNNMFDLPAVNDYTFPGNNNITDADFVSLDTTGMCGARQANGELPITNFGYIKVGSEAIDAGVVKFGVPTYGGAAPDLGWHETDMLPLVTSIDIWGTGGVTTITVEDGTLQILKKTEPTNAGDTSVVWSLATGTGDGAISPSGLVTAYTDGTVTITATANDGSGIHDHLVLTFSNQEPTPGVGLPVVVTSNPSTWTAISIYLPTNEITDDGGGTISDKGICWSTSASPTTTDSHVHCGTGTATFSGTITGLKGNTTYHFRAFATNEQGTAYGGLDNSLTTPRFSVFKSGKKRVTGGPFVMISR